MEPRLDFIEVAGGRVEQDLGDAVRLGFKEIPKRLPCRFFYDEAGSALFEEITKLPEYYLTRCETEILRRYSGEIVRSCGPRVSMVEFGSGSSLKTRLLIEAGLERQGSLHYVPIDISKEFLKCSSLALLDSFPGLTITALATEYESAICRLPDSKIPRLILFLGSNIGNFSGCEATAFLGKISSCMSDEDGLLLGVDLVKDRKVLYDAYNDSSGVTARFNKNLLNRINLELGANFDLNRFKHEAPFNEAHSRIEMRLVSTVDQHVSIGGTGEGFDFEDGEFILTEWSHKYTIESVGVLAEATGLKIVKTWLDPKEWFAEFLLKKV